MRTSLAFLDLEPVTSLLAVDQVALSSRATFYAHYPAGNSTPTDQLRQVLALTAGAGYAVAPAAAGELPPSPLDALLGEEGGGVGGAVLAG
ncbi:hypothetical protein TeGR_g2499, partial [Tetraparma gracilis]